MQDKQPSSAAPPFPPYPAYAPFPPYPPYPPVVIQCCCHGSHGGEPVGQQQVAAQPPQWFQPVPTPANPGQPYPPSGIAYPPVPSTPIPTNPVTGGRTPPGPAFNPFDPLGSILNLAGLPAPVDPVSSFLGSLFRRPGG